MKKLLFLLSTLCAACVVSTTSVSAEPNVLLFAGSLRQGSLNKKLVNETADIARKLGATVQLIELNDYPIPFYNGDEENSTGMPENAKKIRSLMKGSQVIFIASPNYNRSMPGVLKNLLDWASRNEMAQESYDAYQGKTFALMCSGPGGSGGVKGLDSVRQLLQTLKGNVLAEQFVLPHGNTAYDLQNHLKDLETKMLLENFIKKALNQNF